MAKAVDYVVLAAKREDHIEGHHGTPLRVDGVADGVLDDIGQPDKENSPARRAWAERVSDGLGETGAAWRSKARTAIPRRSTRSDA